MTERSEETTPLGRGTEWYARCAVALACFACVAVSCVVNLVQASEHSARGDGHLFAAVSYCAPLVVLFRGNSRLDRIAFYVLAPAIALLATQFRYYMPFGSAFAAWIPAAVLTWWREDRNRPHSPVIATVAIIVMLALATALSWHDMRQLLESRRFASIDPDSVGKILVLDRYNDVAATFIETEAVRSLFAQLQDARPYARGKGEKRLPSTFSIEVRVADGKIIERIPARIGSAVNPYALVIERRGRHMTSAEAGTTLLTVSPDLVSAR